MMTWQIVQGILGICIFILIAWSLSENRKIIKFKSIFIGIFIQFFVAFITQKVVLIQFILNLLGKGVNHLKMASLEGSSFVFGYIGGADLPFKVENNSSTFIFAFQALPVIIVVSGISMLLFHLGILPAIIGALSRYSNKIFKIGGALGACVTAKIFLGNIEAPLLIRPYIKNLSRSELFTLMTAGMSTTSISMITVYASILEDSIPNPISHILTASVINIISAINISRILIPDIGKSTEGKVINPYQFNSSFEALSQGAIDGIKLVINIIAILIVVIAIISLCNSFIVMFPILKNEPTTLQGLWGYAMSIVTYIMGISWEDSLVTGKLLSIKTILNETVAFIALSNLAEGTLNTDSMIIISYALCGFANLSVVGMQIAALIIFAPTRKLEIIELGGMKALFSSTMASCLSGTIMGIVIRI